MTSLPSLDPLEQRTKRLGGFDELELDDDVGLDAALALYNVLARDLLDRLAGRQSPAVHLVAAVS
jgi:hypothetical protein